MNKLSLIFIFLFMVVAISIVATAYSVWSNQSPAPAPVPAPAPAPASVSSSESETVDRTGPSPSTSASESETETVEEGRCGPNHGDKKCTGTQCCSKTGWCGGEKGVNSNWCVNINKGWWSGKYDGEAEAPALVISDSGGYNIHKGKYLPTARGTDVDWATGQVRPTFGRAVTGVRFCKTRCDELDACKGFTYKPAVIPKQRRCWLKTDMVQTATLSDSKKYDTYMKE